jgi:hypothetical protein
VALDRFAPAEIETLAERGAAWLAPRQAIAALRHSGDIAGFVGGASRSAGAGQGDRADRRRDRPRILLSAVARGRRRDEPALRTALAQLEEAELLFRSGVPPDARYTFKHALVQDTAYETLLRSRRQILQTAEAVRPSMARNSATVLKTPVCI